MRWRSSTTKTTGRALSASARCAPFLDAAPALRRIECAPRRSRPEIGEREQRREWGRAAIERQDLAGDLPRDALLVEAVISQ
jgi:hypothetical protein